MAFRAPSRQERRAGTPPVPGATRFAPSPTGYLHLGHAHAALFAWAAARATGGRFLIRMEDIDFGRCRPEYDAAILEDLAWLGQGLDGWAWEEPARRQSQSLSAHAAALDELERQGLLYPCFCTRRRIRSEVARAGMAPHGPEGPLYPGTCREMTARAAEERRARGEPFALRLDMAKAAARAGRLVWRDLARGEVTAQPEAFGDVVLARKDTPTSYHLAVTLDDHAQGVSLVTRGEDLFAATHIHRLLQALLGLDTPDYLHHRLLADAHGRRLAKRNGARSLRALRAAGVTPAEARRLAEFDMAAAEVDAVLAGPRPDPAGAAIREAPA